MFGLALETLVRGDCAVKVKVRDEVCGLSMDVVMEGTVLEVVAVESISVLCDD